MKWRITFTVPSGVDRATAMMLNAGQEYEGDGYEVTTLGGLALHRLLDPTLRKLGDPIRIIVIEFAPGVWRSIMAVGAAATDKAAPSEDPRRRQEARPVPAA